MRADIVRRTLVLGLAWIGIMVAQRAAYGQPPAVPEPKPRPIAAEGEFLVVLKPSVGAESLERVTNRIAPAGAGTRVIRTFKRIDTVHIKVPAGSPIKGQDLRRAFIANSEVEAIEPNYIYYPAVDRRPNDPKYSELWHLEKIGAPQAWSRHSQSDDVIVAVIDSGILLEHADLKDNLWKNPGEQQNGVDDDGNGFVDDIHGVDFVSRDGQPEAEPEEILTFGLFPTGEMEYQKHGSHVAGIIAASGDNQLGITGVTWRAQVMALKFFGGPDGGGRTSDAIQAIDYAISKGARIINASWGGTQESIALKRSIERANSAGILFVAAAGNGGSDGVGDDNDQATTFYPASYDVPNVLAVAATTPADGLTDFSNFGATSVGIAAPGLDILSTVPGGKWNKDSPAPPPDVTYEPMSGTSMAAPVVSGAAALILSRSPDLGAEQIKAILLETVDGNGSLVGRVTSNGRLSLARAVAPPLQDTFSEAAMAPAESDRRQQLHSIMKSLGPDAKYDRLVQPKSARDLDLERLDKSEDNRPGATGPSDKKELIVGLKNGTHRFTRETVLSALKKTGISFEVITIERVADDQFLCVIKTTQPAVAVARKLEAVRGVDFAEPNVRQRPVKPGQKGGRP